MFVTRGLSIWVRSRLCRATPPSPAPSGAGLRSAWCTRSCCGTGRWPSFTRSFRRTEERRRWTSPTCVSWRRRAPMHLLRRFGFERGSYNGINPGGTMIKADIVDLVVDLVAVPRAKAATAVETVIESMRSALGAGDRIELRGFGVFQVKRRKRGIGRNPKTGVEVTIPPGNTIRFKPGKDLRDLP